MNIALLSPNKNAYSETFIQAHKKLLKGTVFFYYDGELPSKLENGLLINSRRERIIEIVKGHFNMNRFSLAEQVLIKSFAKNKIDLVFAEYGSTGEKVAAICKELNLPLIVHFHGFDASVKEVISKFQKFKKVFETASFIIAVSKKMEMDLLKMGCPKEKLKYNVCGPDNNFFKVTPNFSKPQFISIGRFVDKKAPYYLILAFKEVVLKFPDAQLVMAGNGKLINTCKNLANYYGLEDNLKFPGVISPVEYRDYLKESIAFVQHSITAEDGDAEGTPVGILEASAAGLPVISTMHAGIPDVIINNKTGLLVKEHSVSEMADKMIYILQNRDKAKELGSNGRSYISNNFSMDRHINFLNDLVVIAISK